ncbi:SAM-dependent methyltransferase [Thauera linaloolentis]|uniref:Methyltransferase n=2 Tax=Thauera linaloolentis TaxID=76112 RepID=N6Z412_THAL4|nr:class I SAM-dependent methyltransferase [Thauera linaloolentis]ENO89322.1 methyltransferase [Thauera linaloolentis 47Lol = DSM 12138]
MWDQRYASDEYVYGTEPNGFLAEHAALLDGPVLNLAEGEGRNAVFLASRGLDVLGVDGSAVGLAKAHKLAASKGVSIRTETADLTAYSPPPGAFGAVVSIFAHLPGAARKRLHHRVEQALRPGGVILLEGYGKAQLERDTGGPKDIDMLLSRADVEADFLGCDIILSRETERDIVEGRLHTGLASVVQFIARKRPGPPAR